MITIYSNHSSRTKTVGQHGAVPEDLFGLPLDNEQLELFRQCTGRTEPLSTGHNEAWLVCGRRGGKSFHPRVDCGLSRLFQRLQTISWDRENVPPSWSSLLTGNKRGRSCAIPRVYCSSVPMLSKLILNETAREHHPAQPCHHRSSYRIFQDHAWLYRRRCPIGRVSISGEPMMLPNRITKWSTHCDQAWQRYQTRCCSVHRRPTHDAVNSGTPIVSTLGKTMIRCWSGKHQRE